MYYHDLEKQFMEYNPSYRTRVLLFNLILEHSKKTKFSAFPLADTIPDDVRSNEMKLIERFSNENKDLEAYRIKPNKAKCLLCGDIIRSKHRHDFVECKCGSMSLDGGYSYVRVGGDLDNIEFMDWDAND